MYVAGLPQDSFIAFLVLDPVGLRPYKQFFREQKGWIWFDLAGWFGAGWHNSGQTNPRPVRRSHPREGAEKLYDPGKPNEALMNKNSWTFIKNPKFCWIHFPWPPLIYGTTICLRPCIQDLSGRHIVDLQCRKLWICVWPDVGRGQVGKRGNGLEDTRNQLFVWKSKALPAFWEVWVVKHQ